MTLSGPNACRGSTKDARTYQTNIDQQYPPMSSKVPRAHLAGFLALAGYRGRKRIVDSKRHLSRISK